VSGVLCQTRELNCILHKKDGDEAAELASVRSEIACSNPQNFLKIFAASIGRRDMIPGATIIRECSACGNHIAQNTIVSGNTIGARYWTDGNRVAPMLPDQPLVGKCQHCDTLIWIKEQRKLGEIHKWGSTNRETDTYPDALPVLPPTFQDFAGLLKAGLNDKNKERYLRLRAWWAGNDSRRKSVQKMPLSSLEVQNLRAFVALLDESEENDRIMKAEVFRELCEFEEAEKLLSAKFNKNLSHAVSIIRKLNHQRISTVVEMIFE
jgi:hypothetical protein